MAETVAPDLTRLTCVHCGARIRLVWNPTALRYEWRDDSTQPTACYSALDLVHHAIRRTA